MDEVGGARSQGVNPDCPNAANPFHRCAGYCPVPAPRAAVKPSPPRPGMTRAAQNGTKHGDGAGPRRAVAAAAAGQEEAGGGEARLQAVHPDPDYYPNAFAGEPSPPRQGPGLSGYAYAAQNGTAHREEEPEPEITVVDESEEVAGESAGDAAGAGGARRRSVRPAAARDEEEAGQWQAVNTDCPNAANPFHRCAEYCPVPVPRGVAKLPPPRRGQEGSTHSDPGGELQPRPRRREKGGGSGGLPLYVFLREGSDGDGKKVDPRCPNAPNPFHVCTDHCLAKMAEAGRSSEGGKSPISLFSRHSRRSSSSSEEGSVKSTGSRKVDPKCPNAGNPFHECGQHCAAKMQQVEQPKGAKLGLKSPRRKGGKDVAVIQNWKVDPRCPNASNPFHMCAQYCFDHLNETAHTSTAKSDKKKGKSVSKEEERGEINPDCVNASNPYHKCGDHCKRKGDR